jgi:hypothetical protein
MGIFSLFLAAALTLLIWWGYLRYSQWQGQRCYSNSPASRQRHQRGLGLTSNDLWDSAFIVGWHDAWFACVDSSTPSQPTQAFKNCRLSIDSTSVWSCLLRARRVTDKSL